MVEDKNDSDQTVPSQKPMADSPHVLVIGSISMDLVVRTTAVPAAGEMVSGHNFASFPGGKGATQAVAAARCQAKVSMIGRVGNDDFGQRLRLGLTANGVETSGIMVSEGISTGANLIMVNEIGENAICHTGGANLLLSIEDIDEQNELIHQADAIVMQLEIPQQTIAYVIEEARHHRIPVILNPAPALESPEKINPSLFDVDVLIPNQDETSRLCGEPVHDAHSAKLAGSALVALGAKAVVVTLGRRGAMAITAEQIFSIPPFNANVVDTTGAGDAFCGAFAVAFAQEKDLKQATRFAAAAGALACNKFGGQASLPHRELIQRLLQRSC
jgi:ribokinase